MKKYTTFKKQNEKPLQKFYSKNVFWAFNNTQFEQGLLKFNIKKGDTNKLISIGAGGFMLKTAYTEYLKISKQRHKAIRKYMNNSKQIVDALYYEMGNFECGYTGRYWESLKPFGLSLKDLENNKKLYKAYKTAKHKCWKWFIENN